MNKSRFLSIILISAFVMTQMGIAQAATLNYLQTQKNQAAQKAKELQQQAQQKASQADNLSTKVSKIATDISTLEAKIKQNQSSLSDTQKNINQTEAQIDQRQASLEESQKNQVLAIQIIYITGRKGKLEILLSSDSLSEAVARQQYLSSLGSKIEKASREIKKNKQELESKKTSLDQNYTALTSLKKELAIQSSGLQDQKAGQQRLLFDATTEMQRLKDQAAQQSKIEVQAEAQIQAELSRLTANHSVKVAGIKVHKGDIIGYQGSTGNSSGAHVHFEVRTNGIAKNPHNYLSFLRWPLDKFTVTQEFGLTDYAKQKNGSGCTYGGTWPSSCAIHTGIDVADSLGVPVRAAGDGDIILDKYYGGYGNAVIIDHGNDIYTLYGHMLAK